MKHLLSDNPAEVLSFVDKHKAIDYVLRNRALLHRLGWLEQFLIPVFTSHNIDIDSTDPYPKLEQLFPLCNRSALMDAGDSAPVGYQDPDQEFTLHRGVYATNSKIEHGYSWTSSVEVAQWFADWDDQTGIIISGRFSLGDVLFYKHREEEFVIDVKVFDEGRIEFRESGS